MKPKQKYIQSDQCNPTQMSVNLSKSQQKLFCKSIHEQIKERTQSKETTHRSTQNNQLSQRVKQQGSLSTVIANFFGPSGQKKSRMEGSENIEKSKNLIIKDLQEQVEQKDEKIEYLSKQLSTQPVISLVCPNCEKYKLRLSKITSSNNLLSEQLITMLRQNQQSMALDDSVDLQNNNFDEQLFDFKDIGSVLQIQKQQTITMKSFIQKFASNYNEQDDRTNKIFSALIQERNDLEQKVLSLQKQVTNLTNNEIILKSKLEQLQNPYQKYKNQLQQSASITKINSDIEIQMKMEKNLNLGQPYLRSRYISQKENSNSQMSVF